MLIANCRLSPAIGKNIIKVFQYVNEQNVSAHYPAGLTTMWNGEL
jgi:hypothetical protein